MKRLLLFFALALCTIYSNAQETDTWELLNETTDVFVYYQLVYCESEQNVDPIELVTNGDQSHETFKLKVVNNATSNKTITFSKVTKMDGTDEFETITVSPGTKLLETCETAPKMMLTRQDGDQYPIAVMDYLNAFKLTIEN